MKDIINVPVTIIPIDIFKLKILELLSGMLRDTIAKDYTDSQKITDIVEATKEFFNCPSDFAAVSWFEHNSGLFDHISFPYFHTDAFMVFVEIRGGLYPLYKLTEVQLDMKVVGAKVIPHNLS